MLIDPTPTSRLSRVLTLLLLAATCALGTSGCRHSGKGGGGGAWLVGQDGAMLRVSDADDGYQTNGYDLGITGDLLVIACRGSQAGWAVGEGGALLRTLDGGATWERITIGTDVTLRAVSAAAFDVVYAAGDGGTFLVSYDSGANWRVIDATADWTTVATTADGTVALLGAADGSVWRYDDGDGSLAQLRAPTGSAVRSVVLGPAGLRAALAGDGGELASSDDGGTTWNPVATGTSRNLYAVRRAADADLLFAAGDAGVVVRVADGVADVEELLDPGSALRALHLSADGSGALVGDGGVVLMTADFGESWDAVDTGMNVRFFGVDDIGEDVAHL